MLKNILLNRRNLFDTWGARMADGSVEALLTPAPMKSYITNSVRGEHGARYVIPPSSARMDKREVSVSFILEGNGTADYLSKYESFTAELAKGNVSIHIPDINRTFRLVYLSCGKYGHYGSCRAKITAKFIEPDPQNRLP